MNKLTNMYEYLYILGAIIKGGFMSLLVCNLMSNVHNLVYAHSEGYDLKFSSKTIFKIATRSKFGSCKNNIWDK